MRRLIVAIILLLCGAAIGSIPSSNAQSPVQIAPQMMTTVGSNLVAKAYPGYLYGFIGTTGSTPGCFYVFNATSLPGNGSVTPDIPPIQASANTTVSVNFAPSPPSYMNVGITIGFSSTCGLTFTASSTALISAMVQ